MTLWYYEKNGTRSDSITEAEMITFICQGVLSSTSLLWCEGMDNWQPLAQTSLAVHLPQRSVTPPPLPPVLPPLSGTGTTPLNINNVLVYTLALSPLIGLLLRAFLLGLSGVPEEYMDSAITSSEYWYVPLLLTIGLSYLDAWKLKQAGIDTRQFSNITWLVPVWLWKRAQLLKHKPVCFWIWIASFVLTLCATAS